MVVLWGILSSAALFADSRVFLGEEEQEKRLYNYRTVSTGSINTSLPDEAFLLAIASDTWKYFQDVTDRESGFTIDNVIVYSTHSRVYSYTSVTNIGLQLMCIVSGYDFGFISADTATVRIERILDSIEQLDTWKGMYFNYYETDTLNPSGSFVSTVDNGWLAAGIIVAKQAFPDEVGEKCQALIDKFDFGTFYNEEIGQLCLGYDAEKNEISPYHYGLFCTEPRIASYIAIAKEDVPLEHWFSIPRTLPSEWEWQQQIPQGVVKEYEGRQVYEGYYTYEDIEFVPSWGGSLFEFLMPTMVLKEQELGRRGLGLNNKIAINAHINYAINESSYPVWGISPCAVPSDLEKYSEYGVPYLGSKGYDEAGVVTPHVSFLALPIEPEKAIRNIREFSKIKGMYGQYGFYDSVDVQSGEVATKYLCLDQAMTLISINNYLHHGIIRSRFHQEPMIKEHERLLYIEQFF